MNRTSFCGVLICCLALIAGCNKSSGPKKLQLAFVTNNPSDFWTIARAGCNKAQEELPNVTVDFKIPDDGTAATQMRILDDLLSRGIDGVAISPVDPANEISKLDEVAKKALLFCTDSDAPGSDRACYVGTDNVAAGKQAGGLIKEVLPDGGNIMLFVGKIDAQNAKDRCAGIREALEGSNVKILDVRTDDADPERADRMPRTRW